MLPSALKMCSWLAVCLMAVMAIAGVPTRNGPLQLAATLGSEVTLRTTALAWSAAHSSEPTRSRRLALKPDGRAQAAHAPAGVRSQSAPVLSATYMLEVAPAKPPWKTTASIGAAGLTSWAMGCRL